MATHNSAAKRYRQSIKRQTHNRWWKSRVKSASKSVLDAIDKKDKKAGQESLKKAMAEVRKAKREGVIHANTAARKIARLSKRLAAL